jgi:hypothetical protein
MSAIITKDMRLHNAKQFVEAVSEVANTKIYAFVGKPAEWAVEGSPDTPTDTYRAQVDIWDNMIALKKVTGGDISHVIPRNNWSSGNVYAQYSDAIPASNLFFSKFVVVNSNYDVYKCLNNSNAALSSTVEPTGTGLTGNNLVYTADGYTWKYMYTVDTGNVLKFATTTFIPVKEDSTVSANAANTKGIYAYRIVSANVGSGTLANNTSLTIVGDGSGAQANVYVTSGNVTKIVVINPGSNYTVANITTSTGNAVIEPIIAPAEGHGYNAIDELGGVYTMVNIRLEQTDTDIPNNTKFRQVGLIKDPFTFGTTTIASASTLKNYGNLTIGSPTNTGLLLPGATITSSNGANATVVSFDSFVNSLNYIQTRTTSSNIAANFKQIVNGDTISVGVNSIGTVTANATATIAQNSGEIMYIDNRNVISRASDQVESLYVVLEF